VKQVQGLTGIILGGAVVVLTGQSVLAAPVQVTAVELNPTAAGVDILLQTRNGDRPQVFAVNRGTSWTADVTNAQLSIPGGSFRQVNPAPGISLITVTPLDRTSVRVTAVGQQRTPVGSITRPEQGGLVFSLRPSTTSSKAASAIAHPPKTTLPPLPTSTQPQFSPQSSATPPLPAQSFTPSQPIQVPPPLSSIAAVPPPSPKLTSPVSTPTAPQAIPPQPATPPPSQTIPPPLPAFQGDTPLVPNPIIRMDGGVKPESSIPTPVPALLPRAVAPPVGDIAASQIDTSPVAIDLGTAERVPRLVLRDAPAREVLSLLARAAGLNLAFVGDQASKTGQQAGQAAQPGQTSGEGAKVTLDIENEPVQNVFNYVLQVTGLQANRVGRTIFVGANLPNEARNLLVRSLRLNQVPVSNALNFLVSLGAESSISRERLVTSVNAVPIPSVTNAQGSSSITQTQTTTEQRLETQRVDYKDSSPILRGLQVSGDERTNTLTLVGSPKQVEIAVGQLVQLDVRRRQVAVNVRVVDVNLLALDRAGTSFSFGIDQSSFINSGGVGVFNFGRNAPASTSLTAPLTSGSSFGPPTATGGTSPFNLFNKNFFTQLQVAVTSGNAKILTDPTLVVQEGQTATVDLVQEVITNISQTVTGGTSTSLPTLTVTVEKTPAGLTLPIKVDRIDDNGFITLSVAPIITRPEQSVTIQFPGSGGSPSISNPITLLSRRSVSSGNIRLRDGQTLVLSGIIQDEDRSTVTKIPILGDIPILGALFRSTERQNTRREVIVLLTPRIVDDSQNSTFGYYYSPSPNARQVLEQNNPPNR